MSAYDVEAAAASELAAASGGDECGSAARAPLFVERSAHRAAVRGAAWYAADSGLFATGCAGGDVAVWDARAAQVVSRLAFGAAVHCVAMPERAARHALVAVANGGGGGGGGGGLRLADLATGAFAQALPGHSGAVRCAAWLPRCEWHLASGGADGGVRLWDVRRPGALALLDMHNDAAAALDGGMGAVGGVAATGAAQAWRASGGASAPPRPQLARAHARAVTAMAASADGMWLLTAGADARMRLWDLWTGRHTHVHYEGAEHESQSCAAVALSTDGTVAYGCGRGSIKCWGVHAGGEPRARLCAHLSGARALAAHPHTPALYSGGGDGEVATWEPGTLGVDGYGPDDDGDEEQEDKGEDGDDGTWGFRARVGDQWSDEEELYEV